MKIHHSVLLNYPGIKRILMMCHRFHLHLASNQRTSESSDELRIPLKKSMCGEHEPRQQGSQCQRLGRGMKYRGSDFLSGFLESTN